MTFSIILKSQLEGAKRLDAEYYQPEFLEVVKKIYKFGFDILQNFSLIDITKGETPLWRGDDYLDRGLPFLRSENLIPSGLDLSNIVYVSEKAHKRMQRSIIFPNDVLLAIVGATIGQTGLAINDYSEYNCNQAVAIIRSRNEQIANYLSIVLETKFCQLQIDRLKGGGARDNLDLHEVKVIKIPKVNKALVNYCDSVVRGVKQYRESSKNFYRQAEELLLEELGLKDYKNEESLFSVVKLSEVKAAGRMDAEYFQGEYKSFELKIRSYETEKLGDIIECVPAKFKAEADKNYHYVELANINSSIGLIDGSLETSGKELPSRAKRALKTGDVIVSSIEGSLDKVALVYKEEDDYLASTGFFQFRSKKILPEVLFALAKSPVFQMQLEKRSAGAILAAVPKEQIKDILIPILPKSIQQKITELVKQSHEARKKAKELLEEAKRKVEEMIERK